MPPRAERDARGENEQQHQRQRLDALLRRPHRLAAHAPAEDQRRDDQDAGGVALPPGPPVPQDLPRAQLVPVAERQHRDARCDHRARRGNHHELDDVLAALEAAGDAERAAHQRAAGERLERVAGREGGRREPVGIHGDVDQRRAKPDPGPEAPAEKEHGRERDARGRPHRGRVAGRDRERERGLGGGEIGGRCLRNAAQARASRRTGMRRAPKGLPNLR